MSRSIDAVATREVIFLGRPPPADHRLIVRGLASHVTAHWVHRAFSAFGPLHSVALHKEGARAVATLGALDAPFPAAPAPSGGPSAGLPLRSSAFPAVADAIGDDTTAFAPRPPRSALEAWRRVPRVSADAAPWSVVDDKWARPDFFVTAGLGASMQQQHQGSNNNSGDIISNNINPSSSDTTSSASASAHVSVSASAALERLERTDLHAYVWFYSRSDALRAMRALDGYGALSGSAPLLPTNNNSLLNNSSLQSAGGDSVSESSSEIKPGDASASAGSSALIQNNNGNSASQSANASAGEARRGLTVRLAVNRTIDATNADNNTATNGNNSHSSKNNLSSTAGASAQNPSAIPANASASASASASALLSAPHRGPPPTVLSLPVSLSTQLASYFCGPLGWSLSVRALALAPHNDRAKALYTARAPALAAAGVAPPALAAVAAAAAAAAPQAAAVVAAAVAPSVAAAAVAAASASTAGASATTVSSDSTVSVSVNAGALAGRTACPAPQPGAAAPPTLTVALPAPHLSSGAAAALLTVTAPVAAPVTHMAETDAHGADATDSSRHTTTPGATASEPTGVGAGAAGASASASARGASGDGERGLQRCSARERRDRARTELTACVRLAEEADALEALARARAAHGHSCTATAATTSGVAKGLFAPAASSRFNSCSNSTFSSSAGASASGKGSRGLSRSGPTAADEPARAADAAAVAATVAAGRVAAGAFVAAGAVAADELARDGETDGDGYGDGYGDRDAENRDDPDQDPYAESNTDDNSHTNTSTERGNTGSRANASANASNTGCSSALNAAAGTTVSLLPLRPVPPLSEAFPLQRPLALLTADALNANSHASASNGNTVMIDSSNAKLSILVRVDGNATVSAANSTTAAAGVTVAVPRPLQSVSDESEAWRFGFPAAIPVRTAAVPVSVSVPVAASGAATAATATATAETVTVTVSVPRTVPDPWAASPLSQFVCALDDALCTRGDAPPHAQPRPRPQSLQLNGRASSGRGPPPQQQRLAGNSTSATAVDTSEPCACRYCGGSSGNSNLYANAQPQSSLLPGAQSQSQALNGANSTVLAVCERSPLAHALRYPPYYIVPTNTNNNNNNSTSSDESDEIGVDSDGVHASITAVAVSRARSTTALYMLPLPRWMLALVAAGAASAPALSPAPACVRTVLAPLQRRLRRAAALRKRRDRSMAATAAVPVPALLPAQTGLRLGLGLVDAVPAAARRALEAGVKSQWQRCVAGLVDLLIASNKHSNSAAASAAITNTCGASGRRGLATAGTDVSVQSAAATVQDELALLTVAADLLSLAGVAVSVPAPAAAAVAAASCALVTASSSVTPGFSVASSSATAPPVLVLFASAVECAMRRAGLPVMLSPHALYTLGHSGSATAAYSHPTGGHLSFSQIPTMRNRNSNARNKNSIPFSRRNLARLMNDDDDDYNDCNNGNALVNASGSDSCSGSQDSDKTAVTKAAEAAEVAECMADNAAWHTWAAHVRLSSSSSSSSVSSSAFASASSASALSRSRSRSSRSNSGSGSNVNLRDVPLPLRLQLASAALAAQFAAAGIVEPEAAQAASAAAARAAAANMLSLSQPFSQLDPSNSALIVSSASMSPRAGVNGIKRSPSTGSSALYGSRKSSGAKSGVNWSYSGEYDEFDDEEEAAATVARAERAHRAALARAAAASDNDADTNTCSRVTLALAETPYELLPTFMPQSPHFASVAAPIAQLGTFSSTCPSPKLSSAFGLGSMYSCSSSGLSSTFGSASAAYASKFGASDRERNSEQGKENINNDTESEMLVFTNAPEWVNAAFAQIHSHNSNAGGHRQAGAHVDDGEFTDLVVRRRPLGRMPLALTPLVSPPAFSAAPAATAFYTVSSTHGAASAGANTAEAGLELELETPHSAHWRRAETLAVSAHARALAHTAAAVQRGDAGLDTAAAASALAPLLRSVAAVEAPSVWDVATSEFPRMPGPLRASARVWVPVPPRSAATEADPGAALALTLAGSNNAGVSVFGGGSVACSEPGTGAVVLSGAVAVAAVPTVGLRDCGGAGSLGGSNASSFMGKRSATAAGLGLGRRGAPLTGVIWQRSPDAPSHCPHPWGAPAQSNDNGGGAVSLWSEPGAGHGRRRVFSSLAPSAPQCSNGNGNGGVDCSGAMAFCDSLAPVPALAHRSCAAPTSPDSASTRAYDKRPTNGARMLAAALASFNANSADNDNDVENAASAAGAHTSRRARSEYKPLWGSQTGVGHRRAVFSGVQLYGPPTAAALTLTKAQRDQHVAALSSPPVTLQQFQCSAAAAASKEADVKAMVEAKRLQALERSRARSTAVAASAQKAPQQQQQQQKQSQARQSGIAQSQSLAQPANAAAAAAASAAAAA